MPDRITRIIRSVLFILYTNVIYGFILYWVFIWLSGYSLLYAYLGNLALIIIGLAWDESNQRLLRSKKLVDMIKKEKDVEKNFRFIQKIINDFISFKTALYLFYAVILIVSQILSYSPALANENIVNFIRANEYSILLLVAFDTIIVNFSKDKQRMQETSQKLNEYLSDNGERQ